MGIIKNYDSFINEAKKSIKVDYDKKFGKKVAEINELIEKAKKDDILAIETDSTWESIYEFDKVVLTKTQLQVYYKDGNKKKVDKISLAKDKEMDYEEVKYIFSWIKKTIKKGYREDAKQQKDTDAEDNK